MNNDKKHQVHNLIILDESGSMQAIKQTIIQGFNEMVQTIQGIEQQFPEQVHYISLISFNGLGQKILHFLDPVNKLNQIDDSRYHPTATTPLFDAIGFGIHKLKYSLEGRTDYNVLVTVLTDGAENASREFSGNEIRRLIEELKQNRWTFTYIGTDHDITEMASSLSINNTMSFKKNITGINEMFLSERRARVNFSEKIRRKEYTSSDYFTAPKDQNTKS